jgi:hypothetical protein
VIPIGTSDGLPVFLDPKKDLKTHLHCMGTSQLGKSRLIEHLCAQLFLQRKGFALIDPHGKLYERIVRRLALLAPFRSQEVTLFDASAQTPHGFDPFHFEGGEEELHTRARMLTSLTLQIWGIERPDDRPRFNNWLFNIYHTLMEQGLSLSAVLDLLRYDAAIPGGAMRQEWEELHQMSRRDFQAFIEPLRSRFRSFNHPRLRRILERDTIDVAGIVERKGVLLANLKESRVLTEDENRTLAALFIGYLWHHFLTREKPTEFYVIIDEFQMFATERVASILDQSAKFGLHMMLFHQREGHMSKNLLEAMNNATAKLVFTGERRFTLNGREVESPHVPDLDKNPSLDAIAARYVAVHSAPSSAPLPEPQPGLTIEHEMPPAPPRTILPDPATDLEALELYRYLTAAQFAQLIPESSYKQQNTRKRLAKLLDQGKLKAVKCQGKNVYCLPNEPERHLDHDLKITEVHLALRPYLTEWRQTGLKATLGTLDPDAFFCIGGCFFLELQNSNARSEGGEGAVVSKARAYARYADEGRHKDWCDNFRVLFLMQTEAKARNLAGALAGSGIPNLGRFWVGWHGQIPALVDSHLIDPRGETHRLREVTPDYHATTPVTTANT